MCIAGRVQVANILLKLLNYVVFRCCLFPLFTLFSETRVCLLEPLPCVLNVPGWTRPSLKMTVNEVDDDDNDYDDDDDDHDHDHDHDDDWLFTW